MIPSKILIFALSISITLIISGCISNLFNPEFDINKFVKEKYKSCDKPKFCKNLVMVNCNSEADGELYYLNKNNGEQISVCGGACWIPQGDQIEVCKTLCPPKEWDCSKKL